MSFARYKSVVEEGDLVILFLGYNSMLPLKVVAGETYQTRFGALRHNEIIGKTYGTKVNTSKGFLYVLHPTCELWTSVLPHRTQILYPVDISMVVTQLELKPGSVVVESGTGSGSLSHALIRAVAPTGHLYTFDFHEQRLEAARAEFEDHGIGQWVTAQRRDVSATGFALEDVADAVFLDIPAPWNAIPHAKKTLKKDKTTRICSFSPCMEQVQAACSALTEEGFSDVVTFECLARNLEIITANIPVAELGWGDEKDRFYDFLAQESWRSSKSSAEEERGSDSPAPMNEDDAAAHSTLPVNSEKRKCPVFACKSVNTPLTTPGHTGFLTFASLFPSS